jgi:sulfur-oxidizing protein SoxB
LINNTPRVDRETIMLSRRDFISIASAAAALGGLESRLRNAAAQQKITQDDLLAFKPKGQLTLLLYTPQPSS